MNSDISLITQYLSQFTYAGMFIFLVICGFGAPIPEEVPLIIGGYLVYMGLAGLWKMIAVCFIGILLGDIVWFHVGKYLGGAVLRLPFFQRILSAPRREWVQKQIARHGAKAIFIGRFLSAGRAATFFSAGSMGMSARRFAVADACAALISVPVLVTLGNIFGSQIDRAFRLVAKANRLMLCAAIVVGVAATVWLVCRYRKWKTSKSVCSGEQPIGQ